MQISLQRWIGVALGFFFQTNVVQSTPIHPIHPNILHTQKTQNIVHGFYTKGSLQNPAILAGKGSGYVVLRPHFHRNYGHISLVRFVQKLAQAACPLWNSSVQLRKKGIKRANACSHLGLAIGDLSAKQGGLVPPYEHRSHQNGLDVDIGYEPVSTSNDYTNHKQAWYSVLHPVLAQIGKRFTPKQQALLTLAATFPEVERIFVHPYVKKALCQSQIFPKKLLSKIQPWYWHDEHFHVRLQCPSDQKKTCISQAPPGNGTACDQELLARFSRPWPPPSDQKKLSIQTIKTFQRNSFSTVGQKKS